VSNSKVVHIVQVAFSHALIFLSGMLALGCDDPHFELGLGCRCPFFVHHQCPYLFHCLEIGLKCDTFLVIVCPFLLRAVTCDLFLSITVYLVVLNLDVNLFCRGCRTSTWSPTSMLLVFTLRLLSAYCLLYCCFVVSLHLKNSAHALKK